VATDLVTLEELKAYLGPEVKKSSQHDEQLADLVSVASQWVRDEINRDFDERTYAEVLNGNDQPVLPLMHEPVKTTAAFTVTENGVSLVAAFGYSATADVIVQPGAAAPRESAYIHRLIGPTSVIAGASLYSSGVWTAGVQNIAVGYTAGYSAANMPRSIKALVKYLAARAWKESNRKEIGISRRSTGGRSVDFLKELPAIYLNTIQNWKKFT